MPHVIIKIMAGRSDGQKARIAEAVTEALTTTAGVGADAVSVAIEDVARGDWTEKVYRPDIQGKADTLYKEPGYEPF